MKTIRLGLCKEGHEIPGVTRYIFEREIENPMNFEELYHKAFNFLEEILIDSIRDNEEIQIEVYTSGLTSALCAVINASSSLKIVIDIGHYDRNTNTYKLQKMAFCGRM